MKKGKTSNIKSNLMTFLSDQTKFLPAETLAQKNMKVYVIKTCPRIIVSDLNYGIEAKFSEESASIHKANCPEFSPYQLEHKALLLTKWRFKLYK